MKYIGFLKCLRLLRVESQIDRLMPKREYANMLNILRLVCGFSLIAHWLGCFWYVVVNGAKTYDAAEWDMEVL